MTYALLGLPPRYWDFFPASEDGWGRLPAWGYATSAMPARTGLPCLPPTTHINSPLTDPSGVTSPAKVDFVAGSGLFDHAVAYDELTAPGADAVLVDIAGRQPAVRGQRAAILRVSSRSRWTSGAVSFRRVQSSIWLGSMSVMTW